MKECLFKVWCLGTRTSLPLEQHAVDIVIAANQVTEEGLRIFSTVHMFTALDIIM